MENGVKMAAGRCLFGGEVFEAHKKRRCESSKQQRVNNMLHLDHHGGDVIHIRAAALPAPTRLLHNGRRCNPRVIVLARDGNDLVVGELVPHTIAGHDNKLVRRRDGLLDDVGLGHHACRLECCVADGARDRETAIDLAALPHTVRALERVANHGWLHEATGARDTVALRGRVRLVVLRQRDSLKTCPLLAGQHASAVTHIGDVQIGPALDNSHGCCARLAGIDAGALQGRRSLGVRVLKARMRRRRRALDEMAAEVVLHEGRDLAAVDAMAVQHAGDDLLALLVLVHKEAILVFFDHAWAAPGQRCHAVNWLAAIARCLGPIRSLLPRGHLRGLRIIVSARRAGQIQLGWADLEAPIGGELETSGRQGRRRRAGRGDLLKRVLIELIRAKGW
eukprot:m.224052 g.224052  ORF g.224052 m.224052 type:complete len:393 (-) comp11030_c0_seq1:550-1728(-)